MHPFNVGDLVICVDDEPLPGKVVRPGEPWVRAGRAYRITSASCCGVTGQHGVMLQGLATTAPAVGWHAWRFRKIEAADEVFCERLSKHTPVERIQKLEPAL